MDPFEVKATLRSAINGSPLNSEDHEIKRMGWLDLASICCEEKAEQPENSSGEVEVERWREACLFTPLLSLCSGSLGLCFSPFGELQTFWFRIGGRRSAELGDFMVRDRMPCRRSSGRGASSRPPAGDSHHHCCCCFCHRRRGATPIQPGQAVQVGSGETGEPMLPAFGSVIFSLGRSGGNPGVDAHILVLFTNTPEKDEEGSPSAVGKEDSESGREKPIPEGPSIDEERSGKGKGKSLLGQSSTGEGTSAAACSLPPPHSHDPESPSSQKKANDAPMDSPEDL